MIIGYVQNYYSSYIFSQANPACETDERLAKAIQAETFQLRLRQDGRDHTLNMRGLSIVFIALCRVT